jgi:hypothetical protein
MKTASHSKPDRDLDPSERQAASVCLAVIRVLGRPPDLFGISAVRLWENHFRVNVRTGTDAVSVLIPHSFFVTADETGKVLTSVPRLVRVYGSSRSPLARV